MYFYTSAYLTVEAASSVTEYSAAWSAAMQVSIHMTLMNLLTLPHWTHHLVANITSFTFVSTIITLSVKNEHNDFESHGVTWIAHAVYFTAV